MRAAAAAIATVASLALASMGLAAGLAHVASSATGGPSPTPLSEGPTPTPSPALPSPSPFPSPTPAPSPSPEPTPPPSLYVAIINGNDYGNVEAQTEPGATCRLRVTLPNGSDAPGVPNPKTARADGEVHWSYSQLPTDEGNGIHTVSCALNGLSGTAWIYFEVGS